MPSIEQPHLASLAPGGGTWEKASLWAAILAAALVLYSVGIAVYRLWFHPLAKFPGPAYLAVSEFPYLWQSHIQGRFAPKTRELHRKYGNIVRIGPERLAVDGSVGWNDIFAHRPGGDATEFKKPSGFLFAGDHNSLIGAVTRDNHRRQRRQLAHAFSEAAMAEQEPIITFYIDLFIQRLSENSRNGAPINLLQWLNFVTFDIVGDLALGESFHSLQNSDYHPWVLNIFKGIRGNNKMRFFRRAGLAALARFIPDKTFKASVDNMRYAREKALARVALGVEPPATKSSAPAGVDGKTPKMTVRRDFMTYMMRKNTDDKGGMSQEELLNNSWLLITAGSETTGTNLSVLFFLLAQPRHHSYLEAVTAEVRGRFAAESDMDLLNVNQKSLPLLHACIEEALRVQPAVAETPPRISPGAIVGGQFVPEGTWLNIFQIATFHNPDHFAEADSFRPERFLPAGHPMHSPRLASDNMASFKPFSAGPRDCIGKNLAYAEMRLIAARILLRFDVALAPGAGEDWLSGQRAFGIWEKPPLMLRLTERTDLQLKG